MDAEEGKEAANLERKTSDDDDPQISHEEGEMERDNYGGAAGGGGGGVGQSKDILKALEVVERDSIAIAQSFTSLFSSLRLTLSQVTNNSVDHMSCFNDAAGCLQECVLDAATKGNRYINSCLRLNEEMKGIDKLASELKILRRNVGLLDLAVNKLIRPPT